MFSRETIPCADPGCLACQDDTGCDHRAARRVAPPAAGDRVPSDERVATGGPPWSDLPCVRAVVP